MRGNTLIHLLLKKSTFTLFNFESPAGFSITHGGVAQLGERLLCTQEVRSSILLISTKYGMRLENEGL